MYATATSTKANLFSFEDEDLISVRFIIMIIIIIIIISSSILISKHFK